MVEDQPVCVGARALRYLGRRLYHLHDQHLWCGAVPAHRLPGGWYTAPAHIPSLKLNPHHIGWLTCPLLTKPHVWYSSVQGPALCF